MAGNSILSYVSNLLNMDSINLSDVKESNNQALLNMLDNLSSGETVVGKIISFDENSYTFKTPDNITVKAKADQGINLKTGSTVMFEVVKNSSNGTALRPLYTNTSARDTAATALRQAGIPSDPRAIEYTVRSMEYGAPIDRRSLNEGYKDVFMHEEAPVKYVVDLQKMNIPVTNENLKSYEAFSNMENSIGASLVEISDTIADDFINTLVARNEGTEPSDNANNAPLHFENDNVLLDLSGSVEHTTDNTNSQNNNNIATSLNEINDSTLSGDVKQGLKPELFEFLDDLNSVLDSGEKTDLLDSLTAIKNEVNKYIKNDVDYTSLQPKDQSISQSDDLMDLLKNLMTSTKSESLKTSSNNLTPPPLNELSLEDKQNLLREELKPVLKNTIEKLFEKNWSLNKSEMGDKKEVKDLYDKLYSDSKKLIKVLDEVLPKNSPSQNMVQNLSHNIDFMDSLNHYIPYVQIPFSGENGSKSGELYVFKNNKSLSSADGELSAFVHLDTDNLGPTDVYIKMNGDAVTTHFTLQDEESLIFIEKNLDYLSKRLNDKGYSFSGDVKLNDEGKTPLEIMHENVTSKMLIAKNSFDARV